MTRAQNKLVESAANILNGHLTKKDSPIGKALKENNTGLDLVNEILEKTAGTTLVAAVESNGTLLGYVSRAQLPNLDPKTKAPTTGSPEES